MSTELPDSLRLITPAHRRTQSVARCTPKTESTYIRSSTGNRTLTFTHTTGSSYRFGCRWLRLGDVLPLHYARSDRNSWYKYICCVVIMRYLLMRCDSEKVPGNWRSLVYHLDANFFRRQRTLVDHSMSVSTRK